VTPFSLLLSWAPPLRSPDYYSFQDPFSPSCHDSHRLTGVPVSTTFCPVTYGFPSLSCAATRFFSASPNTSLFKFLSLRSRMFRSPCTAVDFARASFSPPLVAMSAPFFPSARRPFPFPRSVCFLVCRWLYQFFYLYRSPHLVSRFFEIASTNVPRISS